MAEKKSIYETLSEINVSEHIEKKNGLSYLSWAWAWDSIMRIYPNSYSTIYKSETGAPYHTDGRTCWVETGFTVVDEEKEKEIKEYYPITDFRNKSIQLENLTSMDMNTAIQRSLTKCIARHGLGFYIYAGQDLPQETKEEKEKKLIKLTEERKKLETEMLDLEIDFREDLAIVEWLKGNAPIKDCNEPTNEELTNLIKAYHKLIKGKKEKEGK